MKKRSKIEQLTNSIINENHEEASKIFHDYIIEQSKNILHELESDEDNDGEDFDPEVAGDEIDFEEMLSDSSLNEDEDEDADLSDVEDDAEDDISDDIDDSDDSDETDDEDVMDYDDEGDDEGDDSSLEDKVAELESELEELQSEFEDLMNSEDSDNEEVSDEDIDDENTDDEETFSDDEEVSDEDTDDENLEEDEDIFDSLDESVLADLETVNPKMGGEVRKFAGSETNVKSPIPQRKPNERHRTEKTSRLTSGQSQHKGFEREKSPESKTSKKHKNVRDKAMSSSSGYSKVDSNVGSKSKLRTTSNDFGTGNTSSPIGSKGTGGNKGGPKGKK